MDWTEDTDLHRQFKDWREKTELLLDTVLSHIKDKNTKMKFVSLWAGKEARVYLNIVDPAKKGSLETMLNSLEEWTRPKVNEIAVFTQLRALNQGNKALSTYIQQVRRLVDLCNMGCETGDCKDKLIRNSTVAGLNNTNAYQQCILKGSSLSPNECIKICQVEDATHRQVQALCPESSDCTDSTPVHKIAQYSHRQGRHSFRDRGAYQGGMFNPRDGLGGAWP